MNNVDNFDLNIFRKNSTRHLVDVAATESLVMMMQTGKYCLTDNLSLVFVGYPRVGNSFFFFLSFSKWGGIIQAYNIICFLILRLPNSPKNFHVF